MAGSFGEWRRVRACRRKAWRSAFRQAWERPRRGKADTADKAATTDGEHLRAAYRAVRTAGRTTGREAGCGAGAGAEGGAGAGAGSGPVEDPGPPASGFTLMPWLLMGMGAISHLFHGETPNPWIGGLGLLAFNSLYIYVAFRAFVKETRRATSTRVALGLMGLVTCSLALAYGGSWLLFLPLFGLATGAVLRGPQLRTLGTAVAVLAGVVACVRDGWDGLTIAYATWISTMVTAAILSLSEAVRELRAAREELARRAVEEERLRFSRDLHDLLGHTLSVIVVKSEAARRLAPRDMDAALAQVTDIEAVGRQALTEIREAVTGYREGSLAGELDRARSALTAAGVEPSVSRSGPPPDPQTSALLGWVVREAVTNVVRHSGATRCGITVTSAPERVRLTVADDGHGGGGENAGDRRTQGTGLTGLRERLAAAGGSLTAGPGPRGGFTVTAELPAEPATGAAARPAADTATRPTTEPGATADATTGTEPTPRPAAGSGDHSPGRTAPSATEPAATADATTGTEPASGASESAVTGGAPSAAVGPSLGP